MYLVTNVSSDLHHKPAFDSYSSQSQYQSQVHDVMKSPEFKHVVLTFSIHCRALAHKLQKKSSFLLAFLDLLYFHVLVLVK